MYSLFVFVIVFFCMIVSYHVFELILAALMMDIVLKRIHHNLIWKQFKKNHLNQTVDRHKKSLFQKKKKDIRNRILESYYKSFTVDQSMQYLLMYCFVQGEKVSKSIHESNMEGLV